MRKKMKNQSGFTFVEMIVVMVLLAIVLGLSVFGIMAWQDYTNFDKQNEYAQMIFGAAQNQLTNYSEKGQLEDLDYLMTSTKSEVLDVTKLIGEDGEHYALEEVWPQSADKENPVVYQSKIYSLTGTPEDYAAFSNDSWDGYDDNEKAKIKALYSMIQDYIYDKEILSSGVVTIEFTSSDGQVFAVLYSERAEGFVYDQTNTSKRGIVDISNRTESYRMDRMVGYFGVDTLYMATTVKSERPTISQVKLNNEDTLNLTFKFTKLPESMSFLNYEIVFRNENDEPVMRLTFGGNLIKAEQKTGETAGNENLQVCKADFWNSNNNGYENAIYYPIEICKTSDSDVKIILDAIDYEADSYLYAKGSAELASHGTVGLMSKWEDVSAVTLSEADSFRMTQSFHRFGLTDLDRFYCTVSANGAMYKPTVQKSSNKEYAYFASVSSSDSKETCEIKNARHLYNIRYEEEFADETQTTAVVYDITDNIYWNPTISKSSTIVSGHDVYRGSVRENSGNLDFPSMITLRKNSTLTSSRNKDMIGFSLTQEENIRDLSEGMAAFLEKLEKSSNEKFVDTYLTYTNGDAILTGCPTALILFQFGTLKKLNLDDITVEGGKYTGSFAALNFDHGCLSDLTVKNTLESNISGTEYVGGIVGSQGMITGDFVLDEESENKIVYENLTNRAVVSGTMYVGGIVGKLTAGEKDQSVEETSSKEGISTASYTIMQSVEVKNCNNYGFVKAAELNEEELSEEEKEAVSKWKNINNENELTDEEAKAIIETLKERLTQAQYIGGIIGKCENLVGKLNHTNDNFIISDCISSPQVRGDVETLVKDITKFNGVYVGGIAGYNDYARIENCSTEKEKNKEGYIFGFKYVGGIVGFNVGPASGISGTNEANPDNNDSSYGLNEANVIGYTYVGGIVGCNAALETKTLADGKKAEVKDELGILKASRDRNLGVKISSWTNRGIVMAAGDYVGGITGYNTGWIFNCTSDVESSSTLKHITNAESVRGDYAGGIAGYNNGIIGNTDRDEDGNIIKNSTYANNGKEVTSICYISGKNFVGGIVGYNDERAIIEDYHLAGGYITGSGSCVGGYAGLNASIDLLMDAETYEPRKLLSDPNEVTGSYMVGGSIGANIVYLSDSILSEKDEKTVDTIYSSDNFLGNMNAEAFLGGFAGYNLLLGKPDGGSTVNPISALVPELVKWMSDPHAELSDENPDSTSTYNKLENQIIRIIEKQKNYSEDQALKTDEYALMIRVAILENLQDIYNDLIDEDDADKKIALVPSNYKLNIEGATSSTGNNNNQKLGSMVAKVYVGGVIGYNDDNAGLYIHNVVNLTPIVATSSIYNEEEQKSIRENISGLSIEGLDLSNLIKPAKDYMYSYAGGILGKVTENVTIDACFNKDVGDVSTQGTYTGGICEINRGTIKNCEASSIGDNASSYVGGIAGVNFGTIKDCVLNSKTITGEHHVGGIVSENFGKVSGTKIEKANIIATGDYAGGICAVNYAVASILASDEMSMDLSSEGSFAGGLIGVNLGSLKANETEDGTDAGVVSGYVLGKEVVGGIIGLNASKQSLSDFENQASVSAVDGIVAGIIGYNEEKTCTVVNCVNNGAVTATESGNAGGIVSVNKGKIRSCVTGKTVSAKNGNCGGITANNLQNATIEDCAVIGKYKENMFTQFKNMILTHMAGWNTSLAMSGLEYVGAVCAVNEGTINNTTVSDVSIENSEKSGVSYLGLFAGINTETGEINLPENASKNTSIYVYTFKSYAGGVAGKNEGSIIGVTKNSNNEAVRSKLDNISISLSSAATFVNFGGAAGTNEGEKAEIKNVSVIADGTGLIGNLGDMDYGYGGIAGINGDGEHVSVIENCTFDGKLEAKGSGAAVALMGGITGINKKHAQIENSLVEVDQEKDTSIKASVFAYLGGMIGYNAGEIRNCDNQANGSIKKVEISNNQGQTGGIAAYSTGGAVCTGTSEDKKLTTGTTWSVKSKLFNNDCGTGGILGYSLSGQDMKWVENNASVYVDAGGNITASGMISRLENKENDAFVIQNCKNNGDINAPKSTGYTGGIIGRVKYKYLTIDKCENYGAITGGRSGGIMGSVYSIESGQNLYINSCKNYGDVYGSAIAGGMLGFIDAGQTNYFTDCVNLGKITSNNGNSAAYGICASDGNTYIYRCENYYYTTDTNFYGIADTCNTIRQCFTVTKRLCKSKTSNDMGYCLTGEQKGAMVTEDTNIFYKDLTFSGTVDGSKKSFYSNSLSSSQYVKLTKANDKEWSVEANLISGSAKEAPEMGYLAWYFGGENNTKTAYTFQISMTDESNQTWYLNRSSQWVSEASQAGTFYSNSMDLNDSDFSKAMWSVNIGNPKKTDKVKLTILSAKKSSGGDSALYLYGMSAEKSNTDYTSVYQKSLDNNTEYFKILESLGENPKEQFISMAGSGWTASYQNVNALNNQDAQLTNHTLESYSNWKRMNCGSKTDSKVIFTAANPQNMKGLYIAFAGGADYSALSNSKIRNIKYDLTVTDRDGNKTELKGLTAVTPNSAEQFEVFDELYTTINFGKEIENVVSIELSNYVMKEGTELKNFICLWSVLFPKTEDMDTIKGLYGETIDTSKLDPAKNWNASQINGLKQADCNKKYTPPAVDTNTKLNGVGADVCGSGNINQLVVNTNTIIADKLTCNPMSLEKDNSLTNRITVYEDVHPKLHDFLTSKVEPGPIKNPSITIVGNNLWVKWAELPTDYESIQVGYEIYNNDSTVPIEKIEKDSDLLEVGYALNYFSMPMKQEWIDHKYVIKVYLRSINGIYKESGNTIDYTIDETNASAWTSVSKEAIPAAPTPQGHLEMTGMNNNGQFKFVYVLDNADDYSHQDEVYVYPKIDSGTIKEFKILDGKSQEFTFNAAENKIVSAQVKEKNGAPKYYAPSSVSSTQTVVYCSDSIFASEPFTKIGFKGNTMENMQYLISLNARGGSPNDMYCISEVVIPDYEFTVDGETYKCDITFGSGESHITATADVQVTMSNLPNDMLDYKDIIVRSYWWKSQGFAAQYGHVVRESITAGELAGYIKNGNLIDDTLTAPSNNEVFKDGKLNSGYVVQQNTDGTYRIIYSSIIGISDDNAMKNNLVKQGVFTLTHVDGAEGTIKMANNNTSKPISAKPEIDTEYDVLKEDGYTYEFQWDVGKNYDKNANYQIILLGNTESKDSDTNQSVVLGTKEITFDQANKKASAEFVDQNRNWNYPRMTLCVTRIGTVDNEGKTSKFPSYAQADFMIKTTFSQITRPTVSLIKVDGVTQKNQLLYDAIWAAIPSVESEHDDFDGYVVRIERSEDDLINGASAATILADNNEKYDAETAGLNALYSHKPGSSVISETTDNTTVYTYTWSENDEEEKIEIKKTMILECNADKLTISKNLTVEYFYQKTDENTFAGSTITRQILLDDFDKSEIVDIQVYAKAKENAAKYRDGSEGVIRQMQLPSRLDVPKVSLLTSTEETAYDSTKYISISKLLNNGIELTLKDPSINETQGKYQIAVAIYDEKPEGADEDYIQMSGKDADDLDSENQAAEGQETTGQTSSDCWNSGALVTLIKKSDNVLMNNNLSNASYILKNEDLTEKYAGKWLKIAIRATSDSKVSSTWSDEDDASYETANYAWIRIPRVQLQTPGLEEEKGEEYYDASTGQYTNDPDRVDAANLLTMEKTYLNIETVDTSDGYRIKLVHTPETSSVFTGNLSYNVDNIYLIKEESGYKVYLSTTDVDEAKKLKELADNSAAGNAASTEESYEDAVYIGTIAEGETSLKLPYEKELDLDLDGTALKISCYAEISLKKSDAGEEYFQLKLPDVGTVNSTKLDVPAEYTNQVSVQTIAKEENVSCYENSKIMNWYRQITDGVSETKVIEMDAYPEGENITTGEPANNSDEVTTGQLNGSERPGYAYETTFTGIKWHAFEIAELAKDAEGTQRIGYVSLPGNGETNITSILALDESYKDYEGLTIYIRFVSVYRNGGGVSEWGDWKELSIPVIVNTASINTDKAESDEAESDKAESDKAESDKAESDTTQSE